jgi:hypothetical protein
MQAWESMATAGKEWIWASTQILITIATTAPPLKPTIPFTP